MKRIHRFRFVNGYPGSAASFALNDQETSAWFNDLYNNNGYINLYSDGFITQFCSEFTTSITSGSDRTVEGLRVLNVRPGSIALSGLSDGLHEVKIYDAEGRLILAKQVHSMADRSDEVSLGWSSSALYIVRVDDSRMAKFIPLQ